VIAAGFFFSFLFLWLALRKVDLHEVARALRSVNPTELLLALLTVGVFVTLVIVRWRYLLGQKEPVPFGPVFSAVMVGYFGNNVLPARAGELLRAHVLGRRTGLSRTFTFATIVVERLFDVATMLLFLLAVMFFFPLPAWTRQITLGACVLLGGERLTLLRLPSLRRLFAPLSARVAPFRDGLQTVGSRRRLAVVALLSVLIWLTSTLMLWLTLRSFGIRIPLYGVFFTFAVINLGLIIPSAPGFIGTYQVLCIGALGFFHVPESTAFAFSLVQHALWYVPMTLVGFVFFGRESLRLHHLSALQEAKA
jgi:uncharacterized membrane protein YbhN (UPF0104 family)